MWSGSSAWRRSPRPSPTELSWGRDFALTKGGRSSRSICHSAQTSVATHEPVTRDSPLCTRKKNVEKLWREFFSDLSQWWDHRSGKADPKYPDFKHKKTQQSLWLHDSMTPLWVHAKVAGMAPGIPQANIFAWNVKLRRYARAGHYKKTMDLFQQLQREGMIPDKFTFVPVLNACSGLLALEEGQRIHLQIMKSGFECDLFVGNCLVDMYAKCGKIEDAWRVFDKMPTRDVVSWGAMILGYVKCGRGQEALRLSRFMQEQGEFLNPVTLVGVLSACASIGALEDGRRAHEQIIERGYESHPRVASSLINMYAKCGSIEAARRVFNKMTTRDVVSWNALILGYVKCGQGREALGLSEQMQREGIDLDPVTFVGVLNACASVGALEQGKRAHEQIIVRGYECDVYVASALVDLYSKCGKIEDARKVFNKMSRRDVISSNALILGYVKCGEGQEALGIFQQMQQEGVELDAVTFVGVLNACARIGALEEGRRAHERIIDRGYERDGFVASSLVDMYAKCGSIEDAEMVFNKMPSRDVVSWGAMLGGYSRCGYVKEALEHFERMCQEVDVIAVSFVSLLSACTHGGLVDEGLHYFVAMSTVFNISPTLEHYACIVNLLGRAGHLHEAEDLIREMPYEPDAPVWMSLLGACRIHVNVEMGECVAKQILLLEPGNAACHVLRSNINAAVGKWDRVQSVHCGKDGRESEANTRAGDQQDAFIWS